MTIIAISGSVGVGKTSIAKQLSEKLNYKLINLNKLAENYKLEEIEDLQTFDFDIDKLLHNVETKLVEQIQNQENIVFEGHFSHFLHPMLIDHLFVINRNLPELKQEYIARKYNEQKQKDNLEVESFNLCYYEALEQGYQESGIVEIGFGGDIEENILNEDESGYVYTISNCGNIEDAVEEIIKKINQ